MGNINAIITGVAGYVPDYVSSIMKTSSHGYSNDEWIVTRTGIKNVVFLPKRLGRLRIWRVKARSFDKKKPKVQILIALMPFLLQPPPQITYIPQPHLSF